MVEKTPFSTRILSYINFFIVIIAALWICWALIDQPEPITKKTPLSGLALEGRDLFYQQGCANCHAGKTLDGPLIVSGNLFAPTFPFENSMLQGESLRSYLLGPNPLLQVQSLFIEESIEATLDSVSVAIDELQLDEQLYHAPLYPGLGISLLQGNATQAKMLATAEEETYNVKALVIASELTAGTSKIDAIIVYLEESSQLAKASVAQ